MPSLHYLLLPLLTLLPLPTTNTATHYIADKAVSKAQKALQTGLKATQNDTVTTQQKTTQQNTPYYQNPTHTTPQPIHITTPPTPQKNTQPIPHRTQEKKDDNDDDPEPATLQETLPNTYIPSDIKELQKTFKNTLAERITQTIHQKGFKPFTSAIVDYGIDKLTEESDNQLKEAIAQQQQKNKFSYALQKTKVHKTSQDQDNQKQADLSPLLSGDAQPKDEVEQIAQAIAQGAEGDAIPLEILAKKENVTFCVYNSEGELITIKGDGSGQRMELIYTPPQDGQSGHWAPRGIKNYQTTGPTNCLYDAVAALTGNHQSADTLRQYCAQQVLANKDTLKPIIGDYYTLCITRPDAIYTGAGILQDTIQIAMQCEKSWQNFKENHPGFVQALSGILIGQLYDYVIEKNQGRIEGGKKYIAQGLKKLDADLTQEEADWAADKLMSALIQIGRTATHYVAGKTQKALQTRLKATTHRKDYLKKHAGTSVQKLVIPKHTNQGMQGRHIIGHNNFKPGRSILTAKPQTLLDGFHAGKFKTLRKVHGKIIVDFGKTIGTYFKDKKLVGSTKYGTIHFGKNGAHIVPANPFQK